jgi:hypothetical protein
VALEECHLLTLSIADIDKMREEFPEIYQSLLKESINLYEDRLKLKKKTIKDSIKKN